MLIPADQPHAGARAGVLLFFTDLLSAEIARMLVEIPHVVNHVVELRVADYAV